MIDGDVEKLATWQEKSPVDLLLELSVPRSLEGSELVSWIREFDIPSHVLADRLWSIPGMRWAGGQIGYLGDHDDPWTVTFVLMERSIVGAAPAGFAGGKSSVEAQNLFGAWFEQFLTERLGSS